MVQQLHSGGKELIQSFTDLYAWQESHRLALMLYGSTKSFPLDERFGLTAQIRRAAVSVTSNIAEGFSRRSAKEKEHFYRTALASVTEIQNQIHLARDVQYMTPEKFQELAQQSVRAAKLINGLRKGIGKVSL